MPDNVKLDYDSRRVQRRDFEETAVLLEEEGTTNHHSSAVEFTTSKDSTSPVNLGSLSFIRKKRRFQTSLSLESSTGKISDKQFRGGGSGGAVNNLSMGSMKIPQQEKNFNNDDVRIPKGLKSIPRFIPSGTNTSSPILFDNVHQQHRKFFLDFFTTCIDAKWRWITMLFASSFVVSWLVFGTLWWLIYYLRKQHGSAAVCILNVDSWTTAFLFSLETQTTIGYGGRAVTDECPEGVVLVSIQTVIGLFITCSMLGLTFAKLSRPKNRANTVVFSNKAVIALRDSKLCFMFRVADIRKRRLYDCNVRAVLIHSKISKEGEYIPFNMSDLTLTIDLKQVEYTMRIFPIFPLTLIHPIDEDSPLYDISALDLERNHIEVVIILEGTVPHTGMVTQAVASYTSKEILWGHRFNDMVDAKCFSDDTWKVDFKKFHMTYKDNVTPLASAKELAQIDEESDSNGYQTGSSTASAISSYHNATLIVPESVAIDIDSRSLSAIPALKETEA
eukprot:gene9298-10279_t